MAIVEPMIVPRIAPHVRMRYDAARGQHVLLSPERIVVVNETATAVLELCDGTRSVEEIVTELRARYDEVSEDDVRHLLDELKAKHCVEVTDG
ncbi:pyrroloquinoline quinone biosynthesis protein PqqD [Flexivirga endophytica]|uniref:Pyrroloquinoline quinone biosynthesis protein PqqD n=1 Tax=Flexivirga endophytica TaxID=1849103 RepID=A0A916WWC0_9MICO|nr:pyrroloquinoline quinone biosynthesis peptide chaperone PqqD [Flexivirga endophytica]GGB35116.1 pyrroloquinoline quinone biosynthesis protein PqqD [Flexivirga endophytica]GHB42953.1 pyrroloquinoline quinone biosynthesis protein PqqD [Flexivirga endophytica]